MNNMIFITLALTVGLLIGIFFFGGLWLTVKKAMTSKAPAFWFLGSLILRVGITLAGFYWVSAGNWQRLLACSVGFAVSRFIVMRVTKSLDDKQVRQKSEISHEA